MENAQPAQGIEVGLYNPSPRMRVVYDVHKEQVQVRPGKRVTAELSQHLIDQIKREAANSDRADLIVEAANLPDPDVDDATASSAGDTDFQRPRRARVPK